MRALNVACTTTQRCLLFIIRFLRTAVHPSWSPHRCRWMLYLHTAHIQGSHCITVSLGSSVTISLGSYVTVALLVIQ